MSVHVVCSLRVWGMALASRVAPQWVVWSVVASVSDGEAAPGALGLQVPSPHPGPRVVPELCRPSSWWLALEDTLATNACAQSRWSELGRPDRRRKQG